MKRIIISFLLTGTFFSLMAQDTDSTSANSNMKMTNDSTPAMNPNSNMNNMNNPVRTDSSSDMNNNSSSNTMSTDSSSNMNNLNSNMNNPSSNMNNNMKMDSSSNMNNSSNSNMTPAPASNMDNNSSSNMNNSVGTGMMANSLNVQGQPGYASLPVLENSIPDAVVAKVKEKYGDTVYDITGIKRTTDQKVYVIRMGTNGMYKTEMMNEDGSAVQ